MKLPDCMMPDGADPCIGYTELQSRIVELERERDEARAELARVREAIRKEVASGSPWEGLVYADRIRAALAREEE